MVLHLKVHASWFQNFLSRLMSKNDSAEYRWRVCCVQDELTADGSTDRFWLHSLQTDKPPTF